MKNSFFLVIPKQQKNPQRLKDFEESALQYWLAELPIGNVSMTLRLLQDFIIDFNAQEMPCQLRLSALETLRPSILNMEDYLRSKLMQTGFPKQDNDQKILQILVSIEQEFSIGYWMVAKELTHRTVGWFQGKNTAIALQRCIKGLSSIVVSHFIMGMPIPDWVWLDLHSLYKLSVKTNKETTKIPNDLTQANKASSCEDCYKQIVMLTLADPTGLMQKEILLIYNFIETIDALVELKSSPISNQALQGVILTDEDKPPYFCQSVGSNEESHVLYLNFTQLFKAFEQKEKFFNVNETRFGSVQLANTNSELPTIEFHDYLEQRWSGIDVQGSPLFTDRLDRYIAVGLASSFDLQYAENPELAKDLEFLVFSESERLLSCVFTQSGVLSVGSLVSFRKADNSEQSRSLGVVDKVVVARPKGKIIFGMHLITSQFEAIAYRQTTMTSAEASKKALLYTVENHLLEEVEFIITDTFLLKEGNHIKLFVKEESFLVTLKNKKGIGLGYWQFECVRLNEKKNPPPSKKDYNFI